MRREDMMFSAWPKVVRAGETTCVTIRPRYVAPPRRWRAIVRAIEGLAHGAPATFEGEASQGEITLDIPFLAEQEYALDLEDISDAKPKPLGGFRLYAVENDLHRLVPWKGDFHMHSTRSDGLDEPAYVAGACRRIGLDFMALTDHRQYEPSLEAQRAFQDKPIDLAIFPGEEVHPPGVATHILHLGGRESINALFAGDAYRREVAARATALGDIPTGLRDVYAACAWCFDRIRACGGVGILAHPYWVFESTYNVPEPLLSLFMERQPFDALEIIGGYTFEEAESNSLQVARWQEERTRGKHIPVVGVSDAHGCETGKLFGWYYTVVLSPTLRFDDLAAGIRGLSSVAVECLPGTPPRAHGPFRLARFVHYLIREVFPLHDELAFEEGKLMLAMIGGDAQAEHVLGLYKGRGERLYDRLWGRTGGAAAPRENAP